MNNIQVQKSSIHGRGVFATEFLPKGTTLTCDVRIFDESKSPIPTELIDYTFPWNRHIYSICFGFGSFFNHSNIPNVQILSKNTVKLTKTFIILADITKGDELFLNYGYNTKF